MRYRVPGDGCRSQSGSRFYRLLHDDDRGQTTVETAFGIAALIGVLLVAVSALVAVANYLAVTDAAGAIARAEARGDTAVAMQVREGIGGKVRLQQNQDTVTVTVTKQVGPFPIAATATALKEGGLTSG